MKNVFIAIIILTSLKIHAQKFDNKIEALNNYIVFVNENVHTLWMMHTEFDDFNLSLNKYYLDQSSPLVFRNRELLKLKSEYVILPEEIYKKCVRESAILPIEKQDVLNNHLKKMVRILHSVQANRDTLAIYTKSQWYELDTNLTKAYVLLENSSKLFDEFKRERDDLSEDVFGLYQNYISTDSLNPYFVSSQKIFPFYEQVFNLLDATKKGDKKAVKLCNQKIDSLLKLNNAHRVEIMKSFAKYDFGKTLSPSMMYDNFLEKMNAVRLFAINYLNDIDISTPHIAKGKEYYYYNSKYINHINKQNAGAYYLFNLLADDADVKFLKMPEEPNWFKVAYPEKREKEQHKILAEIDSLANDIIFPEVDARMKSVIVDMDDSINLNLPPEPDTLHGKKALVKENPKIIEPVIVEKSKNKPDTIQQTINIASKIIELDSTMAEGFKPTADVEPQIAKIDSNTLEGFKPTNLILLLDVSSSMNERNKLPLFKSAFKELLSLMRPEDYVAIVSYAASAKLSLKSTSAVQNETIEKVIDGLESGGGTNVMSGLKLSYKTILNSYIENGNNRIILVTDGAFEIDQKMYNLVKKAAERKIALSILCFGRFESLLTAKRFRELTAYGKGNYYFVKSKNAKEILLKEAQSMVK